MRTAVFALMLLLGGGMGIQANPITKAEARLVAESLVGINDTSDDNAPVSPYYIFSRGSGQGFVIVSGDDSTAPILGYTEQGDYDPAGLPPQLVSMLQLWNERIGQVQLSRQHGSQRMSAPRRAIASYKKDWKDVTPLIKTHWHQTTPYNNLAPIKEGVGRCMTGCVATAGSQVTYYFRKDNPSELAYDTPTYSYGTPITMSLPAGTPIEWNLMKLSGTGSAKQDSAVAKLMYALGTSAWLTYGDGDGLATSGHNYKMADAMKGQFRLTSSHKDKTEYSQQAWEELIYKNLTSKRPMLYSGVHPESGGHSVVLDGYKASTGLYHFNFGWGGQGDGYYTVDDATGMNGFNSYQDLVFNITPQVQNLGGEVLSAQLFHKAPTDVEVTMTNNGTLDYQGIYIYVNNKEKVPSTVSARDLNTVIEPGKSVTLTFPVTTTVKNSAYVLLCDKNKRIIASREMEVIPTVAALHLTDLAVDGSSESETVDDIAFHTVNNTTATVTATLTNGEGGTYCQPAFQCYLERYNASSKTWTAATNMIINDITFDVGQTRKADFVFKNLAKDSYYRAYMNNVSVASEQTDIQMDLPENCVYFTTREPDLNIVVDGRNATVTGRWNASLFKEKASDSTVCSYDISDLAQLNSKPQAANPNAIFYAKAEDTSLAGIENVVVGDICERLKVQTGADFLPMRPFKAIEAQMVLSDAEPGKWHGSLVPFEADVPYGMQVKKATEYMSTGLATIEHQVTQKVEAMSFIVYITGRQELKTITGNNVDISTDSETSMFDGMLRGYTLCTQLEPNSLVLGEYTGSLYFIAPKDGEERLEAFMPVVVGATAQRIRTTTENLVDGYFKNLSITINKAYTTMEQYPSAPAYARQELLAELKNAEDMLTYCSHEEAQDIKEQNERLNNAIKTFIDAAESETIKGDVNSDSTVDVADIAAIISIMATSSFSLTADVNNDGTIDVADISAVIDIMAR